MAQALTTWTATDVVMARQPIFDADLRLAAFELLYRAVGEHDGSPADDRATATVLVARSPTSGSGGSSAPSGRT